MVNLPKSFYDNYVFKLSIFVEAFLERYRDIVLGKAISLYVGEDNYYLSVLPKQKFSLYIDTINRLREDIHSAIVEEGGAGIVEEDISEMLKEKENVIASNMTKLYEIFSSLLQSLIQIIAIYESGEFSMNYSYFFAVWKYRVNDDRFKDYVVYDEECKGSSLICEVVAVIVSILFYMKRVGVYVDGFFDNYYAKKG